ncbi:unnamed protein product [Gongylonema pulchrum]|uniref:Gluconokinase n=1 Tax=Gongylonema pulchrum TaxID=637853 RepID=A0A183EVR6_9BILA|nr:unnamed protein product [Gongylonema pulchrum]
MVPKLICVMGVSGCGKTTIGELLAKKLDVHFEDGDHYHSTENRKKMAQGIPLTDEDRYPWLRRLSKVVIETNGPVVLACSALKKKYRKLLTDALDGNYVNELEKRICTRQGHFVDCKLLDSQLATLETPVGEKNCFVIDANRSPQDILQDVLQFLKY